MRKLLILGCVLGLIGCGSETMPEDAGSETSTLDATTIEDATIDAMVDAIPDALLPGTADDCLDGADLYAESVDITRCPPLPTYPLDASFGSTGTISLGLWELGQTREGDVYQFGQLSNTDSAEQATLVFDNGASTTVDEANLSCWAKGYYRLRKIMQNPPASYVRLRNAEFQFRFFQFQSDLRNGPTGFKQISSYGSHLVKWVTVVREDGTCDEPTLGEFEAYVASELARRGL